MVEKESHQREKRRGKKKGRKRGGRVSKKKYEYIKQMKRQRKRRQ